MIASLPMFVLTACKPTFRSGEIDRLWNINRIFVTTLVNVLHAFRIGTSR
jgi:hypothetical protein